MGNPTEDNQDSDEIRQKKVDYLMNTFHNQRVFYREGLLQFYCIASLITSGWGLHVQIEPEIDREPFTVAGAWEILSITRNRVAALYVDWSITVPEREK